MMGGEEAISGERFQKELEALVAETGALELRVDHDALREYCRLTGHDYAACKARDRLPAGYLMTFIDPIVTRIMVAFFVKFPGTIKGVVHSSSRIEIFKPLTISARPYREEMRLANLERKSGKKGDYFVADFEVILLDADGERAATDLHQFFLKTAVRG
ncbi:MAG TPA: hypothetical protein VM658_06120 [bacterium]|nr:hypothetical protein [bacterium]